MSEIADLLLFLSSDATDGYGPRPIPCTIDEKVRELIVSFEAMDPMARQATFSNMAERHGFVLTAFAERMCSLAVRTKRHDLIVSGLSALAIAFRLVYFKEVIPVLSLLYCSTQKLGLAPQCLLSTPSGLANQQFNEIVGSFLNRSEDDRSIEAMGYVEDAGASGFRYKRTW